MKNPQQSPTLWAVAAGFVSAGIFLLAVSGSIASTLLIYIPLMPLFAAGLVQGHRSLLLAAVAGLIGAAVGAGNHGALLFLLLFAIPAHIIIQRLWRLDSAIFPDIGRALTNLAFYAALMVALLSMDIMQESGSLSELLPEPADGDTPLLKRTRELLEEMSFVVLGGTAWMQISLYYGVLVLTNALLETVHLKRLPSLRLVPFLPSGWLMAGLLVSGVASLHDQENISVAAKAAFITLLFPYFLVGISHLHAKARRMTAPALWLFLAYFFTLMLSPISLLGFIVIGLYKHSLSLSNRLGK